MSEGETLLPAQPLVVRFEETGEEREVVRYCRRCFPCPLNEAVMLVSPSGVVHHVTDNYGRTDCGADATGLNWWWRS